MTLRSYANRRDAAEGAIVDALRLAGATVIRTDKPLDLIIGFRGRTFLAEVKTPGTQYGKGLNAAQQDFVAVWRGGPVLVLRDPVSAVTRLCDEMRGYAL